MPELPAFPAALEPACGRDIAAVHDPRPLVIVGARGTGGEVGFATIIWATPVSHTPPLVALALRARSHTMGLLRESGAFSLATLPADADAARLAELCGNRTGHAFDKAAAVDYVLAAAGGAAPAEDAEDEDAAGTRDESAAVPAADAPGESADGAALVPVPAMALSWEACAVRSVQEAGDHLLVIGEVTRAATRGSRDDAGRLAPVETLLCIHHGAYAPVGAPLELP